MTLNHVTKSAEAETGEKREVRGECRMHEAAYSSSSIFTPLHFTLPPSAMHAADAVQNTLS